MKLSLVWLFDHINADWKTVDVQKLVAEFNKKTAEIENFYELNIDLSHFTLATVKPDTIDIITAHSAEWHKNLTLPLRTDVKPGLHYLVKKTNDGFSWAKSTDFGAHKEYILPAVWADEKALSGDWKHSFAWHDWIIEVDNKSINHRPDLWCHRGIAREVAAILGFTLKPLDEFLIQHPVKEYASSVSAQESGSFAVSINDPALCRRFAGLALSGMSNQPSVLSIAQYLMRLDSKVIDALVDVTNYVMFDIGQPLHAFDATKISNAAIQVRLAKNKEKITLLDGQTVELAPQDMVIADDKQPLAVAGVMGGAFSAVSLRTESIFLESANFDPAMIRKTATHIKRRTEASARFEKNLDPHLNVAGILRFLALVKKIKLHATPVGAISSLGVLAPAPTVAVERSFIERCLGVALADDVIIATLEKLDFKVSVEGNRYKVTVPTFRATKDVSLPEDIVEEIGRFFGYENVPTQLPRRFMMPFDLHALDRIRFIKQLVAYGIRMHEVYNYALYDETFLRMLEWQPAQAVSVVNPVSENWRLLVTSLIPGLLKNVYDNSSESEQLRFFEWARTWQLENDIVRERKKLSGIMVNKSLNTTNFYETKNYLTTLFNALNMPVAWEQCAASEYPWFEPYQTAIITYRGAIIGTMGKLRSSFLNKLVIGEGYAFELEGDLLLEYKEEMKKFVVPSKYPVVERDISMLVKDSMTVAQITALIAKADPRIISIELRDMFKKQEWVYQRSLTFRFVISDHEKTLSKEETEEIGNRAIAELTQHGAIIR